MLTCIKLHTWICVRLCINTTSTVVIINITRMVINIITRSIGTLGSKYVSGNILLDTFYWEALLLFDVL